MSEAAERLAGNPHLSILTLEEAEALLARSARFTFTKGEVLLREGEEGQSMILLDAGKVEVQRGGRTLATLDPGAAIGEMALLDPAPRSATVVASTDGAAYELNRAVLWELLADGSPIAIKVLQGLTGTVCARLGDVNTLVQEEVVKPQGNVFSRLWKSVSKLGKKEASA
jgi:CRP/FNR family transcriptional regulator, cyclic AMP receptor protein